MNKICPFCNMEVKSSLSRHIKTEHGEEILLDALLRDKYSGMSDAQIGSKYGVSLKYLERIITQKHGANINIVKSLKSKTTRFYPKDFKLETTTVWSFKHRGNWATHNGRYRGNWSPYIPRNLIMRYTQPYETVLDYFCGGGTTAVEAKLLGRRCIARDINPEALTLTKENLNFQLPQNMFYNEIFVEPELSIGDARDLSTIQDNSIDLICSHPPYAGIINYSANMIHGDLSTLSVHEFINEIKKVAHESYRVLKPGRQCAILIGDSRKAKRIVPIGFLTIRAFLDAGFTLRELIIKRQHNCKTSGFWYSNSLRHNFLLLAHEFLPVFEKPVQLTPVTNSNQTGTTSGEMFTLKTTIEHREMKKKLSCSENKKFETTSVWIFPYHQMQTETRRNLLSRFAQGSDSVLEIELENDRIQFNNTTYSLVYVHGGCLFNVQKYTDELNYILQEAIKHLSYNGYCAIEVRDFRQGSTLIPLGLLTFEYFKKSDLALQEIVIVTSNENYPFETASNGYLGIAHKYLLIYQKSQKYPPKSK